MSDKELRRIGFPWSPALTQRDRAVFEACVAAGVPVAMAGGYAHNIEDIVDIHFRTASIAHKMLRPQSHT